MKKDLTLNAAIALAAMAHEAKNDKSGKPYILHPINVMEQLRKRYSYDEELLQIAVLHDVPEDTNWKLGRAMGFFIYEEGEAVTTGIPITVRVYEALRLLTHDKEKDSYDSYISKIISSDNEDAIKVKLADLRHNSDITRLKGVSEKDAQRMAKYHKAFTDLSYYLKYLQSKKEK